jgi:hypothetical protein
MFKQKKRLFMKIANTFIIFASILYGTILPAEISTHTQKKPIIITDFDEVWAAKPWWLTILARVKDITSKQTKSNNANQQKPATLTLQLLDYGRRYPLLSSYIPTFLQAIGKSRYLITDTHKIYRYLKEEKGYTFVIATSKDRILYDLAIEQLGKDITDIAEKAFVSEPHSSNIALAQLQEFADLATTPANYKDIAHKALNIQETNTIIHVPSAKPSLDYYNIVVNNLGAEHDMIFIDDMLDNVTSFKSLQQQTKALRHGIQFLNPQQLAQELVKCGILSEADDREFLQEINYPGIIGSITSGIKHAFMKLKTAIS